VAKPSYFFTIFAIIRIIIPMNIEEMGKALKFRREFLQLRQEDLAEMSSITSRTIHLIERGTGNPSIETLQKLATVLGMELLLQVKKPN
jgi:transcriptional regulator with XRE-family HTH domain